MSGRWRRVLWSACVGLTVVAACNDAKSPPVSPPNPLADSADQVMFGISTLLTNQGLLRAQLQADTAYFFESNSRIEARNEKTTFYNNTGQQTAVLTSREGTYRTAQSNMEARKNVVVVTTDGKRLTTEELKYNQVTNQITSDSAFVLTEPQGEVHGVGFVSDPNLVTIQVKRVTSGSAPITLPGQQAPAPAPGGPPAAAPSALPPAAPPAAPPSSTATVRPPAPAGAHP